MIFEEEIIIDVSYSVVSSVGEGYGKCKGSDLGESLDV